MAELKPCRICGKVPKLETHIVDIPEATTLFYKAAFRCECPRALEVIAETKEEAVKYGTKFWNVKGAENNG